jgi:hypothetical protein
MGSVGCVSLLTLDLSLDGVVASRRICFKLASEFVGKCALLQQLRIF